VFVLGAEGTSSINPTQLSTLKYLLIPGRDQDSWTAVTDQDEIVRLLLPRNQPHFNQAKGTPFTIAPLSTLLGWSGTTPIAHQVLEGSIDPRMLTSDEVAQAILTLLKAHQHVEIQHEIQPKERRLAFRKWREGPRPPPQDDT